MSRNWSIPIHGISLTIPMRRGRSDVAVGSCGLYEHSLGLAFVLLFMLAWVGHALGGYAEYAADQLTHGQPRPAVSDYLVSARFWFESFQNWQSEFLAIARWCGWPCTSDNDGHRNRKRCTRHTPKQGAKNDRRAGGGPSVRG